MTLCLPTPSARFRGLAGLVALALAGCGNEAVENSTTPAISFTDYAIQDAQLHALWDSESPTNPPGLPGTGQARYVGVINLDAQLGAGKIVLAGAIEMTADFGASTISGQASGFRNSANQSYLGALGLSNGTIDRNANPALTDTYFADIAGTLSGGGQDLTISADLSGDFLGGGALGAGGVVTGVVTSSAGLGALFGDFLAQQ